MIKLLSVAIFAGLFFASNQRCLRFLPIEQVCWTKWFDRDDPHGMGDWEDLSNLHREYPGQICSCPQYIVAATTDTNTPAHSTRDTFTIFSPTEGFVCRNEDQIHRECRDYKVQFGCPCPR
ncbi:cartilage intermediate layer protein 1 isoform X2 [Anoplopoma fimbria]|nr:cartilage intermediate layer protein 1 isoform X2 [Anoplopoma fimbria]